MVVPALIEVGEPKNNRGRYKRTYYWHPDAGAVQETNQKGPAEHLFTETRRQAERRPGCSLQGGRVLTRQVEFANFPGRQAHFAFEKLNGISTR